MSFVLLFLNNVVNQTVLVPIDFHCIDKKRGDIFKMIVFCVDDRIAVFGRAWETLYSFQRNLLINFCGFFHCNVDSNSSISIYMTPVQLKSNKCITHWAVGSFALLKNVMQVQCYCIAKTITLFCLSCLKGICFCLFILICILES